MSSLSHHGIKGQRWGVRRFQNKDGTLTAAGRKRQQYLIEVGSGKRKRLIEAAKPIGTSGDYSRDVAGLNRRGIRGRVISGDDNTHVIKKGTALYRTASNPELNDNGTYASLTKNDVNRYIDYGRSGELPGADKSNLGSMKIFELSANRDLKIANGKYITEIITDDVKRKMKNGDADQVKLGKEILESFKRYEEDLNVSFSTSEMRRSKEAYSRTEKEKEFDRELVGKASDRLALYDKTILDYASGKDYRVIRDRLKREGYDGFIDVEDVTTIGNLIRGGANTEYPVVILNANDVLTLKRSVKESETKRRLKRGTKFNSSRGELTNVVQHTSIGGTMYIEGNALILGDSSYLEHHGIRGQRWGVRRFQNRDGSLTNAGRKRLGYATKGAAQTVGKAFKAGVKAGGNAVKAVKAHHEKKEAEKLQKKKDKASKTRLGVMANKDLFTNEEIRKLNERFKLEDEMKMATLQKGVEIAKAVGTIAQNVGTVAKTYEDVTGQSLSPIKRKAAEEKARQDKEDRERRIAREDADEARKAAKEERDIAIHEQTLRKAIASADTQEFTAQKTKAEADSSILDLYKKGQDFNGGGDAKTDATGKSWVEKATSGGDNPFDKMIYDRDPDYRAAKDAHDEKAEWDQHVKERDARIAARERGIHPENEPNGKQNPQQLQSKSQPQQKKSDDDDDDRGGFAKLKEALPFDKGRYVNRKAAEKAKDVKESAEEERTKKQDEKAVKAAIDTIIKDYQHQDDMTRAGNPTKYDREVAASVIKEKAKNTLNKVTHPVDTVAKKISDKAREEKWTKERAKLFEEYQDNREKLGTEFANEAYVRAKKQSLQNLGYRGEALDKKLNETPFSKKKKAKHDAFSIQNGVLFVDSSDYLAHHGIKGQRWGVRRFQNADGTLTDKGRKHYEKAIEKLDRKQTHSDALRGRLERQHPFAVTGSAILGAVAAGMSIAATGGASVAAIAAGSAISAAVNAGITHASYSVSEAWEGRGTKRRQKKRKEYEEMLNHDGMYHVENGTLFINAGEPYLEHHGVKGMKWGKHLMAGKGEAGAGGGSGEDDEKLKEMAKKAGMSVAEFRTKMASKLSGAASKVGEKVYDAAGGSHKKNAEGWRKMAQEESNAARASEKKAHENSAKAASQDRKYGSGGDVYRRAAESDKEDAKTHQSNAKARSERAASERKAYEKSLAGRYDKMKADHERKTKMKRRKMIEDAFRGSKETKQFTGTSPKAKKKIPSSALNQKHTDTIHRKKSVGEVMNNAKKEQTPGSTPIAKPTQYTHTNRPRGREKYYKLGQESKGVKKRSRRVKHFDGSGELYTEGTRLVVNSKWG